VQLAVSRVLVGIGEAACVPPSHSAISDYFPSEKRATAFAIFGLGIPIGVTVAAVGGGLAAQHLDWRWAFFILGIPGVLAALVLKLTVKEPARAGGNDADAPSFMATLRYLSAKRSLRHAVAAHAVAAIFAFSFVQFTVSYFIRAFEVDIATASGVFGLIAGIGAAAGIFLGGFMVDRLSAAHPRVVTWLPAIGCSLACPLLVLAYLQSTLSMAFVFFLVGAVLAHMYITPSHIIGQSVSHPRMRATVSAIILTAGTLIGYGIGPPLVGAIADYLSGQYLLGTGLDMNACIGSTEPACITASAYGLRIGSIILLVFLLWSAVHFWLAGKTYIEDKVS
jgi:MFS family permease